MPSLSEQNAYRQHRREPLNGVQRSRLDARRLSPSLDITAEEAERLRSRITIDPATGCWLWRNRPNEYGKISWRGIPDTAHRVMMELYRGERIPKGHQVHHECERPGCVNPAHLRVLSRDQHVERHASSVGRRS